MDIELREDARTMLEQKLAPQEFLRVTITEGGCAGLTYGAEVDRELKDTDRVIFTSGKIRIVADTTVEKYLNGLTIDYSDDLINGGLRFTNSKAKSTCGCGSSFNLSGFPIVEDGKCGR